MHPSADKLYQLLKRARPTNLSPGTMALLQDISKMCVACQTYARAPMHCRIRTPSDVIFNHELTMDVFYLMVNDATLPCLSVVDVGTGFTSAAFLSAVDTVSI